MSFRTTLAAALWVAATSAAMAANQTVSFGGQSAQFMGTSPLLQGGQDVIGFSGLAPGHYDFLLTLSGIDVHISSLSIDGVAGVVDSNDRIMFAHVSGAGQSPFALTLAGWIDNPLDASYSGQIAASPAPEPSSAALMLAGLGAAVVAAIRRRRRR